MGGIRVGRGPAAGDQDVPAGACAPLPGVGNFFAPTVIADLPDDARLMIDEPFGPIAGLMRFKTIDEVLVRANSLAFGPPVPDGLPATSASGR